MTKRPRLSSADEKYLEHRAHVDRMDRLFQGYRKAEKMTLEQLRALWDSYDGAETADPDISGECVHARLNELGDGHYCAV